MVFTVWLLSYLFRQFTRLYGVNLFRTIGGEITEVLLAVDTVFSIAVGLVAVTIFSHQHGIPLRGILAGVSIGGLALSFAAQNTLEQLFGTVVLLLDKPFIQGEYIRLPDGEFGRVESVGLRSTKIRTAGKNTLLIVPNSKMADWKIENVTRGRKVMILIYMDFERFLGEYEKSLVCQTVNKYIDSFFGIEPNTSSVTFLNHPEKSLSRARVTFFILGSTKNSIELRKRVTEISKTQLLAELQHHGLNFTANEPVISVDSTIAL
ncbi:MAG: mechanosensitive ion channel family protein [Microcoleaceae cyanobacterium]